jgi:DNA-binding protein HU-beta
MELHTIHAAKALDTSRVQLVFDDGEKQAIDLEHLLKLGGVFEPLRDPQLFKAVEIGPHGRTILWHVDDDVVDLCADSLWLDAHPEQREAVEAEARTVQLSARARVGISRGSAVLSLLNKKELVDAVASEADLPKTAAHKAVDAVFESISGALRLGGEVRLVGFGTFSVLSRAASEGRNPRTGEKIKIAASKQAKFKPGRRLRDSLN